MQRDLVVILLVLAVTVGCGQGVPVPTPTATTSDDYLARLWCIQAERHATLDDPYLRYAKEMLATERELKAVDPFELQSIYAKMIHAELFGPDARAIDFGGVQRNNALWLCDHWMAGYPWPPPELIR